MRAYNLFRRKDATDLCCAVPEDIPVPGFDAAAAETSAGANGFYLFHSAA
jgi:hypothetical protein